MLLNRLLSTLSTLLAATSAQTISGFTFDGRDVVSMIWGFEGALPARYDFWLCAGDETTGLYESLARVITDEHFTPGDWVSFRVDPSIGGSDPNAYFLRVIPSSPKDTLSGFTSHFTLAHMKGSFSAEISEAVKSMQPVALPQALVDDAHLLDPAGASPSYNSGVHSSDLRNEATDSVFQSPTPTVANELDRNELRKRLGVDAHNIPYGEQTGLTKYAPMPKKAGTTIADKSPTPQYPPFPFSIATTYLGPPTVQYTDTAYLTWTTHSIENTAAPAAVPTLDKRMQMWLERWKD
ncbi:uncharacterized protein N7459_002115 [Penicillium hispanicum]|uniref:uncharacterized protein n=1 Tax=Penicillium hispanicum TaxID=1080232 RepID=UPI0025425F56|nr:uncharacterized protein N7459_002115 [Penicillium hispanicum]KAJ5591746.1 hypothetical protein N7459_002115 [Penicillium hispanicum]